MSQLLDFVVQSIDAGTETIMTTHYENADQCIEYLVKSIDMFVDDFRTRDVF
eukprot:UN04493